VGIPRHDAAGADRRAAILDGVERICPYLALADDGRTVADGFDAEHRCHALTPPVALDRPRQVQLCLTEAHVRCERFTAVRTAWLAASSGLPRVAPDVAFGRTRLIVEPDPAWRNRAGPPSVQLSRRTVLIAGAGATLVVAVVLAGVSGIFGGAQPPSSSPTPQVSPSIAETPTPSPVPPSAAASASAAPTPTPAPAATPTPAPTPQTYVVQSGDTLNGIAQRFDTTAAAIAAANGLLNDVINVGQRLIIP
jgi:LysM repeat protein